MSTGPLYASTIFENVTLNNSDYNSLLGNQAVPKGYVDQKVADLVNGAPAALDTLKELSDALNGDANLATSLINLVSEEKKRAEDAEAAIQSSLSTATTSLEGITVSLAADIAAENTKVNLNGPNMLTGPLAVTGSVAVGVDGNSYLYIGNNWRIKAGNNGKTLVFEYASDPNNQVWRIAVPFIQTI